MKSTSFKKQKAPIEVGAFRENKNILFFNEFNRV